MKFAGRMNSFMKQESYDLFQTIKAFQELPGITHLEFNFPEHIEGYDLGEIQKAVGTMAVNGVATRFQEKYLHGEFTNPDPAHSADAVQMCKDAADACRALKGEVLTIWLGYDGFDYSFQLDYERKWNRIIQAFQEIADYAPDIKISIEYKPCEPRAFSMLDGIGLTLLAVKEIDRPNLGVTLDFCHMLMKREHPAFSLAMAAKDGKLYGLHMNDGYRELDNGLIFGTVNFPEALEFVYYLKKYRYDGVVFFDSFPFRENAKEEIEGNIEMFTAMNNMIDSTGMEAIQQTIDSQQGVAAQKILLEMLQSGK